MQSTGMCLTENAFENVQDTTKYKMTQAYSIAELPRNKGRELDPNLKYRRETGRGDPRRPRAPASGGGTVRIARNENAPSENLRIFKKRKTCEGIFEVHLHPSSLSTPSVETFQATQITNESRLIREVREAYILPCTS